MNKLDILVVTPSIPLYDRTAGGYRIYNMIKVLLNRYSVSLLSLRYRPELSVYEKELRESGVNIIYLEPNGSIKDAVSGREFKKVVIEFCNTGDDWLSIAKEFETAELITDSHCLNFLEDERMRALGLESGGHEISKSSELELYSISDMVITVTEMEKDILVSEIGGKIEVIPTGTVIPDEIRPRKGRNNILFVGSMNRTQNIDAVSYFCGKVFPDVKAVLNEVILTIAGSGADSGNLSFIPESAAVTGFVRDIGVYYSSYAVSVVPLRVGAGMKSKIIESMAWGCPVVSTVVGAEGMGFTPGNDILIADDPKEFAEKIVNVYTDQDLWNKISLNAYQKVKEYYGIGRMSGLILDLI